MSSKQHMTPSEAFVETLVAQGVKDVFGIVGSAFMDALDLFPAAGIRFVPTVHEQGAAHMADGYSRVTGRHGVCIAQNGPGITNFVTGVAAAYWAHSPVVAITPETGTSGMGLGGFQETEQLPIFSRITKFFPPLVTGIVITTIGLTLMPVAARWAMGGNSHAPDFGSMANIGLAAITLVIVLLLSKLGSASISRLSILLAMVVGTLVAVFFGMADFSQVLEGPLVALPSPLHFGAPEFQVAAILSMLIVIVVTLVETSADILAVGEIIDTKVDSRRLGDGLRADMASSILAPIFGSFTQSAFAQNVGLVAVTGIKSRYVVATGGLFLVILGLLPVMGRVIAAVPTAVLGGAGVVLFGTVAASGIRTLVQVDYRNNMNLVIVATSIGFGMIPIAAPGFYHHFPAWFETIFHSGISSAAIMAILLNLTFNHLKAGNSDQQSVFVAASERTLRYQDIAALHDGDYFRNGKLYDADGNEVPLVDAHHHAAPPPRPQMRAASSSSA